MNENFVFGSLFCIAFLLFVIGIFYNQKLINILKTRHVKLWQSLGSPSLILNNSLDNNKQIWKFLRTKDYLKYGDPKLIKVGGFLRFFYIFYLVIFAVIFFAFVFLIARSGGAP